MKKKHVLNVLLILIFLGISASLIEEDKILNPKFQAVSTAHPKIYINGESALDAFPNKTGAGTSFDPYIISNLEIDALGIGTAVEIRGIFNRYLILDGISATNSGSDDPAADAGILIANCRNIVIQNCEVANNNLWGLLITISSNCEISGNEFFNNEWTSIQVDDSTDLVVTNNEINTETNQYGIGLSGSTGILVASNILDSTVPSSSGIDLHVSSENTISQNTILGYDKGVHLHDESSNNEIFENTISDCQYGVYLEIQSNDNLIKNNKFSNNGINFFETNSTGNRLISTTKIIIWACVGVVLVTGIVLSSIYLPKIYKKRAPIREQRQAERDRIMEEMQIRHIEEQKILQEEKRKRLEEQQRLYEQQQQERARNAQEKNRQLEQMIREGVICTQCGKALPEKNLKFCVYCGKPQKLAKSEMKATEPSKINKLENRVKIKKPVAPVSNICPHCGRELMDSNLKFCVYCGMTL